MPRKFTVTKAEVSAVEWAIRALGGEHIADGVRSKAQAVLSGLLTKVGTPPEVKMPGISLLTVERALEPCRKYACWIAGNPARHLKTLQQANATPDQIRTIGVWLDTQPWMRGRWTLGSLANKWGEWLAQAQAGDGPQVANWTGAPARLGG